MSTIVCFLGFLCDSSLLAFLLPGDKKLKFSTLREHILSFYNVGLLNASKKNCRKGDFVQFGNSRMQVIYLGDI